MRALAAGMRAGRGRPLRFFGVLMAGWVALRVTVFWLHAETAETVLQAIGPEPADAAEPLRPLARATDPLPPRWTAAGRAAADRRERRMIAPEYTAFPAPFVPPPESAVASSRPGTIMSPILPGLPRVLPVVLPSAAAQVPSRWSGSAWLVARGGSGIAPGVAGGQLGGSQAGVRVAFTFSRAHRLALAGRLTSPLGPGLREGALGLEWQPTRWPVRIVAEHRLALGEGRGGPAIGVIGGFGPVGIPLDFRLEGYGQAGAIRRVVTERYADGAVRLAHSVVTLGAVRFDLGAGVWSAAQRGASRLDLGPSFGISAPLAGQPVRLSLEWRQRVAGDARPGSGLALTLGGDF